MVYDFIVEEPALTINVYFMTQSESAIRTLLDHSSLDFFLLRLQHRVLLIWLLTRLLALIRKS